MRECVKFTDFAPLIAVGNVGRRSFDVNLNAKQIGNKSVPDLKSRKYAAPIACRSPGRRSPAHRKTQVNGMTNALSQIARKAGPYLLIEVLLPGGSIIALLLWLFRHRFKNGVGSLGAP